MILPWHDSHHAEFQKIVDKYDLKNEDRAERLAWFLTNTDNVTVTADMVQKEFGFSVAEAETFLSWIEVGVKFKKDHLGESGNKQAQLAGQMERLNASGASSS